MDTISTIDEVLKVVPRFRILCVGRAGVGKSSLVNRVFGITEAKVSEYTRGEAAIDQELVSDENTYFVLHDSKGFEAGDNTNFELADRFVRDRHAKPDLKDKLHAIWLCIETPRAGGRVLEEGDKKLLALANELQTPVVVVFTKYDALVRSKELEQRDEGPKMDAEMLREISRKNARDAFEASARSLSDSTVALNIPTPPYIYISGKQKGYESSIAKLVDTTHKVVHDEFKGDAWVIWAVAQRASLPMKIKACIEKGVNFYYHTLAGTIPGVGDMLLRECLAQVHQDIITCWNFKDKGEILSGVDFKHLMMYLVQDVRSQSSPTHVPDLGTIAHFVSLVTASTIPVAPPVAILGLAYFFVKWVSNAVLERVPDVERLLMTYTIDLISVLTSLFDFTLKPDLAGSTNWEVLQEAFECYGYSARRKEIHAYCRTLYGSNGPVLKREDFRQTIQRLLDESMESKSK